MTNAQQLWQRVLADLQISLSAPVFKTWLSRTECIELDTERLVISCPNPITHTQLSTKYRRPIEEAVTQIAGQPLTIVFTVEPSETAKPTPAALGFDVLPEAEIKNVTSQPSEQLPISQLNPNYTFHQFVVGNTNRVAHAAALAVTDNPGKNYNPFFLYGGTGVGKTHLVQAIGNALIAKNTRTKVLYCSIERFMNDFIYSIRFKTTNEFKSKYRSCDVLIVDDIQFIAGDKASTQEEFFHTFNELHASGRQIIICSDRPPREIPSITDRLVSRFEGGLSVDISPPDFETRAAIIQAKAARLNLSLSSEIVSYLAEQAPENIRSMEGMMLKLQTISLANQQPLNLAMVQSMFGSTPSPIHRQTANPNELLKMICEMYGITLKELLGKRRTQQLVIPRHLAMYLLRQDLGLNLETIGQILGGRDHTTIMHGIDKVSHSLKTNEQLRTTLQTIRQTSLQ